MNLYAAIEDVRLQAGAPVAKADLIARMIEGASREADNHCGRHFYAMSGTRYFDCARTSGGEVLIDDLLSLTTLTTDSEGDDTFDGETWLEGSDFFLSPDNKWPKTRIREAKNGDYSFPHREGRYIKAIGIWGYGDGISNTPYESSGVTVTLGDTAGTSATVSADGSIKAGQTILVESEQMYVSAVGTLSLTVKRGVNGTTAAAHSSKAANIYRYPADLVTLVSWLSVYAYEANGKEGYQAESIGDYSYTRSMIGQKIVQDQMNRCLAPFMRGHIA